MEKEKGSEAIIAKLAQKMSEREWKAALAEPVGGNVAPEKISQIMQEVDACPAMKICQAWGTAYEQCEKGGLPPECISSCIANLIILQSRIATALGASVDGTFGTD